MFLKIFNLKNVNCFQINTIKQAMFNNEVDSVI